MITFNLTGLDNVLNRLRQIDLDRMCLDTSTTLAAEIKQRVHTRGEASDGSQIGTYSDGYMKVRTGNFKSDKIVRGKNKGGARPKYNRTSDTRVVLSLTRQMENDLKGNIKTPNGYGIGFSNELNYQKALWQDDTKGKHRYKKPIWELSEYEKQIANETVRNHLQKLNLL